MPAMQEYSEMKMSILVLGNKESKLYVILKICLVVFWIDFLCLLLSTLYDLVPSEVSFSGYFTSEG